MTEYSGDHVLDIMSRYAVNRNNAIEKLITSNLCIDQNEKRILEFGAGKGEFILRYLKYQNLDLHAVEIDLGYFSDLNKKVKTFKSIEETRGDFDGIFLIDVLEHIENDIEILKQLYSKLKKGGRIFIYVPARMELYSDFDKSIGHIRRYSKKELKSKAKEAGFEIERLTYHDLAGYFASGINKTFGRGDFSSGKVKIYDRFFFPVTLIIEKIWTPIGKSIYMNAFRK